MTIPFAIPFGRRRLVLSLDLMPITKTPRTGSVRPRQIPDLPAAIAASDAELARLNSRAAAAEDRLRWETQAVFYGLRPR